MQVALVALFDLLRMNLNTSRVVTFLYHKICSLLNYCKQSQCNQVVEKFVLY